MNVSKIKSFGLFVVLAGLWGTSFVAIEVGLASIPPVLFAAIRFDLAAAVLVALAVLAGRWRIPNTRTEWAFVVLSGTLLFGLHYAFMFLGMQYVTGAVAAVLMGLAPVVTPVLASLFLTDERLDPPSAFGILLGFFGVIIVAQPSPDAGPGQLTGVGLLVLSVVVFALGSVLIRRVDAGLPMVTAQAWMMVVGAITLHGISLGMGEPLALSLGGWAIPAVVYLSVGCTAGGFLLYFRLLSHVGASEASLVSYVTPAFAALGGWLVLGQSIAAATVSGFAVILVGFALLKLRTANRMVKTHRDERRADATTGATTNTVVVRGNVYFREIE